MEKLEVYNLEGKSIGMEDRSKFYSDIEKEWEDTKKITKKVKSIRVILMNPKGRIYLQKRSKDKEVNPGMYDKTLGGHVAAGHSWDMTLIRECAEELGFPAAIVTAEDFDETIKVTDLSVVGVFKKIDYIENFESIRKTQDGNEVIQPWITTIYIGYYDGSIRFADGESIGVEVFSPEELNNEIKNNTDKFTNDLKFIMEKYRQYLKPIKNI